MTTRPPVTINGVTYNIIDHSPDTGLSTEDVEKTLNNMATTRKWNVIYNYIHKITVLQKMCGVSL